MSLQQLILGSSSRSRQELLMRLRLPFEVAVPDVDETPLTGESPEQLVVRLAQAKAYKVAERFPDALIIGADQVGVLDGEILCKPLTHDNAIKQLKKASGNRVVFFIGLCLVDAKNQTQQQVIETFDVVFRKLSDAMIHTYLQKEHALQCAGSFKAEGLGIALVEEFHGSDFSALIGLPLIRLTKMLETAGMGPLS